MSGASGFLVRVMHRISAKELRQYGPVSGRNCRNNQPSSRTVDCALFFVDCALYFADCAAETHSRHLLVGVTARRVSDLRTPPSLYCLL
ncbi:hypothetical protein [Gordonia sp. NPDC058843]|uniref:hypothetical protein n=1 Tax=Gordonia sp. NPDC058843 TaxID=3346648 RepID=UPI003676995A